MSATILHPDFSAIQAYAAEREDPGGVEEHIQTCLTCGTLAMSLAPCPESFIVDPDTYVGKKAFRSGGMGTTYTARDLRIGRDVIIKEPAEPRASSLAGAALRMERRLLRERNILGLLEHPAIVPLYATGQWPDGTPFFVMRRIHGPTLAECIAEAESFSQRILLLPKLISIIDAIGHAHDRGVVHRDLSPDNMMIGEHGEPYVIDWGIATLLEEADEILLDAVEPVDDGLTRGGVGKVPYASEDQRRGETPIPSFDVYSLGVTLHHLLGGQIPRRLYNGRLVSLPSECPEELVSIVARATAQDRNARFQNAGEFAEELRRYQQGKLVAAHRYTIVDRARRWVGRYRSTLSVGIAILLAIGALATANAWREQSLAAENEAAAARHAAQRATVEREEAKARAETAGSKRDEAMQNWQQATSRAKSLAGELETQRRLSGEQVARLTEAMEAERAAALEAMELRTAAEDARHAAEEATVKAQRARAEALDQARSAREAMWAAQERAADAAERAEQAEAIAEQAARRAQEAEAAAVDAAGRVLDAEARAEVAESELLIVESELLHLRGAAAKESPPGESAPGVDEPKKASD